LRGTCCPHLHARRLVDRYKCLRGTCCPHLRARRLVDRYKCLRGTCCLPLQASINVLFTLHSHFHENRKSYILFIWFLIHTGG
jgi:hypothetical protein